MNFKATVGPVFFVTFINLAETTFTNALETYEYRGPDAGRWLFRGARHGCCLCVATVLYERSGAAARSPGRRGATGAAAAEWRAQ